MLLVLLMVVSNILAEENISLNYPENVIVGEEFEMSIGFFNFSEGVYDIKLDIKNESKNIAYRLWDDGWKSTNYWMNYYINISVENSSTVRLKIVENYYGINNFKIRVRDSSGDVLDFENNEINISFKDSESEEDTINEYSEIDYELDWAKESIHNNNDFKIKVEVFNMEVGVYDVRLWIEKDEKVISEMYNPETQEWKSGRYYISEFFKGPGNKSERIKIRLIEDYQDFVGEVGLFFKIRNGKEISRKIDIFERKVPEEINNGEVFEIAKEEASVTTEVIMLGKKIDVEESEDLKGDNYIIYESKIEIIKKYSGYGFSLLVVILCVLIMWRKLE